MDTGSYYAILKLVHIGALVFWVGPSLGAWSLLRFSGALERYESLVSRALYGVFIKVIVIEHVAFAILLATGFGLAQFHGFPQTTADWLGDKLLLITCVLVPLEVIDMALSHWLVPARLRGGSVQATDPVLYWYHHGFTPLALLFVPPTLLLILWLAVSKTTLWP